MRYHIHSTACFGLHHRVSGKLPNVPFCVQRIVGMSGSPCNMGAVPLGRVKKKERKKERHPTSSKLQKIQTGNPHCRFEALPAMHRCSANREH